MIKLKFMNFVLLLLIIFLLGPSAAFGSPIANEELPLSPEDREFLDSIGEIQMVVDETFSPITYFDEKKGVFDGIGINVMDELSQKLGFEYKVIRDPNLSWQERLDLIKSDKIHVLGGASVNSKRQEYGYFTDEAYFKVNYALIGALENHIIIKELQDVHKYRLGLVDGSSINNIVLEHVDDDTEIIMYQSMEDALKDLKSLKIDLVSENEAAFVDEYFDGNRFDFEIVYSIHDLIKNYAYFTPKTPEGKQLSRILSYGMKNINVEEIINSRYEDRGIFKFYQEHNEELEKAKSRKNYLILISCFVVLLLVILWFVKRRYLGKMNSMASTDKLTQLKNRNALFADFDKDEKLIDVRLYLVDLDDFKTVNYTYGHSFSDSILKKTAEKLVKLNPDANTYRTGDNEILVITSSGSASDSNKMLDVIQEPIEERNKAHSVSASIVWLESFEFEKIGLSHLLNLVDYTMADAKKAGRGNNVKVTMEMVEKYRTSLK